MALADYDTAVEKIAALMCAKMDPALVHLATADFTTTDIIYIISADDYTVNGVSGFSVTEIYGYGNRIKNGDALSGFAAMIYVKDNDIVYSNPVDLYQNRLSKIMEANESYISLTGTLTGGTFGSIILFNWGAKLSTGESIGSVWGNSETIKIIPISVGQQIYAGGTDPMKYFDVSADW